MALPSFHVPFAVRSPLHDGLALLQQGRPSTGEWLASTVAEFVITAIVTAVLAAIVYAVMPAFTRRGVDYLHREPGEAFVYGLAATVALVIAMIALAITVVGLIVVIPASFVLVLVGILSSSIGVLAVGSYLASVDVETEFATVLIVGSVTLAGVQLLPIVGGLFGFVVYAMGFGYVVASVMDGSSLFEGSGRTGLTD